MGYDDPIFVEYDLDSEDEAWLAAYNGTEVRRTCLRSSALRHAVLCLPLCCACYAALSAVSQGGAWRLVQRGHVSLMLVWCIASLFESQP